MSVRVASCKSVPAHTCSSSLNTRKLQKNDSGYMWPTCRHIRCVTDTTAARQSSTGEPLRHGRSTAGVRSKAGIELDVDWHTQLSAPHAMHRYLAGARGLVSSVMHGMRLIRCVMCMCLLSRPRPPLFPSLLFSSLLFSSPLLSSVPLLSCRGCCGCSYYSSQHSCTHTYTCTHTHTCTYMHTNAAPTQNMCKSMSGDVAHRASKQQRMYTRQHVLMLLVLCLSLCLFVWCAVSVSVAGVGAATGGHGFLPAASQVSTLAAVADTIFASVAPPTLSPADAWHTELLSAIPQHVRDAYYARSARDCDAATRIIDKVTQFANKDNQAALKVQQHREQTQQDTATNKRQRDMTSTWHVASSRFAHACVAWCCAFVVVDVDVHVAF